MKIDVFYTGGGIWLAEVDISADAFAVVSSDYPAELVLYKNVDEERYYPEDMISATHKDKLPHDLRVIYDKLLAELSKKAPI